MLFVNNSSKAKKMQLVVKLLHFVEKKILDIIVCVYHIVCDIYYNFGDLYGDT